MPYFLTDGTSVYDRLRQPKFHHLVFLNGPDDFQAMELKVNESSFADVIDFNAISINTKVAEVFGYEDTFTVLLRPDNHIGFISSGSQWDEIRNYLEGHVGL